MPEERLAPPPLSKNGGRAMFAWLREMRDEHPVWRDANDFWHLFRAADVLRVASDPATFSSDLSGLNPSMARIQRGTLTRIDPPEHHRLRRLVSQSFTPRRVAELAPRIAQITDELLDDASRSDRFDLVSQLAYPLPVTVIAELLGVPTADRVLYRHWAGGLTSIPSSANQSLY